MGLDHGLQKTPTKLTPFELAMRILITGGSGLLAVNWALNRRQQDEVWLGLHRRVINIPTTKTVMVDFLNEASIQQLIFKISPDLIIHTASITDVDKCEVHRDTAWRVNAEYAGMVARAASASNKKLIHISTDHLFDGQTPFMTENDVPNPLNIYGVTKLAAESLVSAVSPNALILRVNFFGWGPSYRHSFSDWILASLSQNQRITLYDNVIFSPLYVTEIINAAHQLLASGSAGIFNLASSDAISKYNFGIKLADRFNLNKNLIDRRSYNEKMGIARPLDMSLDNRKFLNECDIDTLPIDRSIALLYRELSKKELLENIEVMQE